MTFNLHYLRKAEGYGNFGDVLTPYFLDFFNIKHQYVDNWKHSDLIGCGSIARRACTNQIVLGAGILNMHDKLTVDAKWWFVRGPLTASKLKSLGVKCSNIYGDPAMMLPHMYEGAKTKKHEIGFIPQYQGTKQTKKLLPEYNIIELLTDNIQDIIDKITECKYVISSSLHGIIVAHAYGIPAAWVPTTVPIKGDGSKYIDYFKGVNIKKFEQSTISDPIFINPPDYDATHIMNQYQNLKYV